MFACSVKSKLYLVEDKQAYEENHIIWKNQRIKTLTAPEGWLSVIGLNWLKPGKNTMGSAKEMDIHLPDDAMGIVGQIEMTGDSLMFESAGEAYVTQDGKRVIRTALISDASPNPSVLTYKSYVFYIIKRGDKYGLRLKNTLNRARYELDSINTYIVNYNMIFDAFVSIPEVQESMVIEDITGLKQEYRIEASISFSRQGKDYKLQLFDGGKDFYFLIFKDKTSGINTYGGGRYMYIERPAMGSSQVILDFNKAFNPPCVFTDYATCPIPPSENYLDFGVEAGEKYPVKHLIK